MQTCSAAETLARTMSNDWRQWQPAARFPQAAATRYLGNGYFPIHHVPKFRFGDRDTFFTIGSCFARNVEHALIRAGRTVLTSDFSVPAAYYASSDEDDTRSHRGVLNKYNPDSMRTELFRALGRITDLPENGFIEVSPGLWYDPQATNIKANTLDIISDVRRSLTEVNSRVRRASVVFITLGLTETWYDRQTGLSLNTPPPPIYLRRLADRFGFHNASCDEVIGILRDIVLTVREEAGGETKFIVTVSPVPMGVTFSGQDAVVANTHSKSTLRSAASVIASEFDFVDYFPSYEMVTNSPRALAWKDDGAHVQPSMVSHVVQTFNELYFD